MAGQGLALLVRPTAPVATVGGAIDALHGASMLGVAVAMPAYRRSAALSGSLAAVSAAIGALVAR